MGLPKPPTSPGYPSPHAGDIEAGRKIDIADIMALISGAYPGELWQDNAVDAVTMPAVPSGKHRIIQVAYAQGDVDAYIQIGITRNNVFYPLFGKSNQYVGTIGADAVTYTNQNIPDMTVRGIILKPGDELIAYDVLGAGLDVYLNVLYLDVFL